MPNKKLPEKTIPRHSASDVYPAVGEAAEKLKAVIPVFGEGLVNAVITAVSEGQVRQGQLELTSLSEPLQKVKVSFENPAGTKDIKVALSGDWSQLADISLDNPLFSPVKGIIYRKRAPADENPIAEIGQTIEPNGAICAISQTKSNIWYLQLPSDKFPKGGILTKFAVSDGKEVEKGGIICYIKKIE